jgi:HK97 gp10 family phage protein
MPDVFEFIQNLLLETEVLHSVPVGIGVEEAAQQVAAVAREKAPVDTGALRDSITVVEAEGNSRDVIADVRYANFVEFGTSDTEPEPFLRPAVEAVLGR